mgnify:CR=1 FL=1
MKVLQDLGQVLHIMDAKLDELRKNRKKFPELTGKETAEIYGQETAIIHIAVHIRHAIKDHGCFEESDMAGVYEYADGAKEEANKYYRNPLVTWFAKGLAKGAEWACVGLEARMEE